MPQPGEVLRLNNNVLCDRDMTRPSASHPQPQSSQGIARPWCPRCDQGSVYRVRVRATGRFCTSARSVRRHGTRCLAARAGAISSERLRQLGCAPEWSQVEVISESGNVEPGAGRERRVSASVPVDHHSLGVPQPERSPYTEQHRLRSRSPSQPLISTGNRCGALRKR